MLKTTTILLFSLVGTSAAAESEHRRNSTAGNEHNVLPQIESIPIRPRLTTSDKTDETYQRLPQDKLRRLQELNNITPGQVIPLQPETEKPSTFLEVRGSGSRAGQSRFP